MSSPVSQALPAAGNLYAATSLAASAGIGVYLDLSAVFEGDITIADRTGATAAATSGVSVTPYDVYAAITTTTGTTTNNGTALSATGTSVTLASVTGIGKGQKIVIENEVVTVSAITANTLTISALQYAHANGVSVYLIDQTASNMAATLGSNLTAANTQYSEMVRLQTGRYFLYCVNTDASNAVTLEISGCNITGVV